MADLKNLALIHAKGWLFLAIGVFASALLVLEAPSIKVALLLACAVWAFCRFYYYAFYVIEHYVDREYKFAGLFAFAQYMLRRK